MLCCASVEETARPHQSSGFPGCEEPDAPGGPSSPAPTHQHAPQVWLIRRSSWPMLLLLGGVLSHGHVLAPSSFVAGVAASSVINANRGAPEASFAMLSGPYRPKFQPSPFPVFRLSAGANSPYSKNTATPQHSAAQPPQTNGQRLFFPTPPPPPLAPGRGDPVTGSPSRSQSERTQSSTEDTEREAGDPPPSPPKKLQHHRKKETASSRVPFFLQVVCFSFWALIFFKRLVIPPPELFTFPFPLSPSFSPQLSPKHHEQV